MTILNKKYIDQVENIISNNQIISDEIQPSISLDYYENAEIEWNYIKNAEMNSYSQFASNGCGMITFGFYKANNGNIYIIEAFMNEIRRIYIASKFIDCLKDIIDRYCKSNYSVEL